MIKQRCFQVSSFISCELFLFIQPFVAENVRGMNYNVLEGKQSKIMPRLTH